MFLKKSLGVVGIGALLSLLLSGQVWAAVYSQPVQYQDGDTVLEGFLAYDDAVQTPRPGILVVHEWKGINDYAKHRAEQLASLGYVAFAADMYGKGVYAKDHEEAAKLSGVYREDRERMRSRAKVALGLLRTHPLVDPSKLGAVGYCFGGTTVLELARSGADLKGVASFHGGLSAPIPAKSGEVKAKILVLHGADDGFVKPEEVDAFRKEMDAAGADYRVVLYPGAVHSFTVPDAGNDPSKGMAYNPEADEKSWQEMSEFFKTLFA